MKLDTVKTDVNALIKEMKAQLDSLERRKKPDGDLVFRIQHGNSRFYVASGKKERYIKTKDSKTLKLYCLERYYKKLEKALPEQIARLEKISAALEKVMDDRAVYESLPDAVKKFADPRSEKEKQLIEKFYRKAGRASHNNMEKSDIFETDRGEEVRSKSEKIIADMLFHSDIPYDYEQVVLLGSREKRYPDFTILNVRTGKVYIWEHMGSMDNEDYREKNLRKIETYQENGYYTGENLILTFETKNKPLNVRQVRGIIKHWLR